MSGEDKGTIVPAPQTTTESKETQHPELTVRSSSLLNELTSLPLLGTLGSFYTRLRDSHWALKSGLMMVEDACSMVLDKLHIGSAAGKCTAFSSRFELTAPPRNEPRREKICLRGFRPGPTQTELDSHRR